MFVDLDRARIFFDTVGPALEPAGERMVQRPALLCLHGGPGFDHTTLRPYFDRFADTHQVIYLDHRGNGRSTGEFADMHLDQWSQDIADFCAALGIRNPVVFGQSFGGMVAMQYAARHPDGLSKLILSSTAARLRTDVTFETFRKLGGEEAEAVARALFEEPNDQTSAAYDKVCLPLYNRKPSPDAAAAMKRAIRKEDVTMHFFKNELRDMDLRAGLANITCPTLIIGGTEDPITPRICSEELAEAFAGRARLQIFEGAGHGTYRDDPDGSEKLLRDFLK